VGILERLASTLAGGPDLGDDVRAGIEAALGLGADGNWAAAEAALLDLSERHREVPTLFVALGEVRVRRGKDEEAALAFGRAVDLAPQTVDGWLGLGETLVRLGRTEPAREALRKVLGRTHDASRRARAHAGRGRVALALDEPPRAVRELRQAAELAPDDYLIAHDLGRALRAAGDPEGWTWLVRAAHAPAARPEWVLAAAEAAPTPAAAEGLLREALETRTGGDQALSAAERAALEAALAQKLCQAGRPEDGLALAEAAVSAAPELPVGAQALSLCHEQAGRYAEALEAALRAVSLGAAREPERLARLALGAQRRDALVALAADTPADRPLGAALRAFADGRAHQEDLVTLGALAPDAGGRRFVAASASPGEIPRGNLFALLSYARDLATRTPELAGLLPLAGRAAEALDRPLLVAVMGEFNTGKSSFVNALCGERVARVGVTPTTATINVLRFGPRGARVLYHDGRARQLGAEEAATFLARLDDAQAAAIRVVEVFMPLEFLRQVEVVDTPGLNSLRPEHETVARGFLTEADAIIWMFAVGQAAKATERDALALAHSAGKRVLGVLNKADQTTPRELEQITAHVMSSLGDRIEVLLPFSAREALPSGSAAQRDGDGGLAGVRAALETRFFSHARSLKRATALSAMKRFVHEARALVPPAPAPTGADSAKLGRLEEQEATVAGALAAERLRLRAALDTRFRQAAAEVAELTERRFWPLRERRTGAADREFLFDLLEDAIFEATVLTARELEASAAGGPALPIAEMVERFRAYSRGIFQGGVVDAFLREHLGSAGPRSELPQLQRALATAIPDLERELLDPLAAAATAAYAGTRAAYAAAAAREQMRELVLEERLLGPLTAFSAALSALPADADPPDSLPD
jgi:tetratricopeptide (TPR) repeat protein/GTP-binding protein EngB required for normal cell division